MTRPRQRRVPQRTCVACRSVRAKRDLIRVVRLVDGSIAVDETGKKSGRGAYLCRQRVCWDTALQRGALERALKQGVSAESRAALAQYATGLPERITAPGEEPEPSGQASDARATTAT